MLQLWRLWTLVSELTRCTLNPWYTIIGNQNVKVGAAHCLHHEEEALIEKTEMTDSVLIADPPTKDLPTGIMMTGEWVAVTEDKGKYSFLNQKRKREL